MTTAEDTVLAYWDACEARDWPRFAALPAVSFFDPDDAGRVSGVTEFWPEPYEPPPGRGHLAERYAADAPQPD